MRSALAAVGLLTRIPVGRATFTEPELAASAAWMPIVGVVIGIVVGGTYAILSEVVTPLVAASLAVGVGILGTGALHEDGLADTADAFGGGRDREEILVIMKDPTHGSYGVIALVLSVGVRVASLTALGVTAALVTVPVIHSLARAGAVSLAGAMSPASPDGLGAAHARAGVGRFALIGAVSSTMIALAALGGLAVPFVAVAAVSTLVVGRIAMRRISGFTGDVLGAAEQSVEVLLLVLAAALAQAGLLAPAPWWS